MQALPGLIEDASRQARAEISRVEHDLPHLASDIRATVDRDSAPMRALVDATTGGSRRAAVTSVVLLIGGVLAQTAAGVLSAVQ